MGECWACRYGSPAVATFYDGRGDPWPLCANHLEIWMASDIVSTRIDGFKYKDLDSMVEAESARGIAEIEDMLRSKA